MKVMGDGVMAVFGVPTVGVDEPKTIFEDDWIVIVDKPIGLLSVPGRGDHLRDSVQTRLHARYPAATGPLLVQLPAAVAISQ